MDEPQPIPSEISEQLRTARRKARLSMVEKTASAVLQHLPEAMAGYLGGKEVEIIVERAGAVRGG